MSAYFCIFLFWSGITLRIIGYCYIISDRRWCTDWLSFIYILLLTLIRSKGILKLFYKFNYFFFQQIILGTVFAFSFHNIYTHVVNTCTPLLKKKCFKSMQEGTEWISFNCRHSTHSLSAPNSQLKAVLEFKKSCLWRIISLLYLKKILRNIVFRDRRNSKILSCP